MELCIATIDSIKHIKQLGAMRLSGTSIFNKTIFVSYICIFPGVYNYNMPCSVQLLHYEHYEHWEQDRVQAPLQRPSSDQLRRSQHCTVGNLLATSEEIEGTTTNLLGGCDIRCSFFVC